MKKICAAILAILLLTASLTACKNTKPDGFLADFSSYAAFEVAVKFHPNEGSFDKILNKDLVSVFAQSESGKKYGVASVATGRTVIPIRYNSISASGEFILAEGSLADKAIFSVCNSEGTEIYSSDFPLSIEDIGGGHVKILENDQTFVYNRNGDNVLFGSILGKDYDYVSCGNFILAKSRKTGSHFIFSAKTGECVHSVLAPEKVSVYVSYAGGNDFIILYNREVSSGDPYKAAVAGEEEILYFDQNVFRLTIGVERIREIDPKRFIYKLHNRYDFGLTPEERANYPLNDGFFSETDYVLSNKTATGALDYVLSDSSMKIVKTLPEKLSPLMTATDGYAAAGIGAENVYLFDKDLNVKFKLPNENYQSLKWSDGALVAVKIEGGTARYGAFDSEGKLFLAFDYTYLSEFKSGKAIGVKNGKAYIVGKDGSEIYCSDETFPFYWDGFGLTKKDGQTGVLSYSGETLIAPSYDAVSEVRRFGNEVYLTMCVGEVTDLFILS
ncbi:MAG: hypothetical protein K5753_06600 [Clostridia bacterium]|nr:hypothetical protein [Clostridia bacterium]